MLQEIGPPIFGQHFDIAWQIRWVVSDQNSMPSSLPRPDYILVVLIADIDLLPGPNVGTTRCGQPREHLLRRGEDTSVWFLMPDIVRHDCEVDIVIIIGTQRGWESATVSDTAHSQAKGSEDLWDSIVRIGHNAHHEAIYTPWRTAPQVSQQRQSSR